jgi:hypothetical protein
VAECYYKSADFDVSYPKVVFSIIEAIKVYLCDVLYPKEDYRLSQKRWILTDFTGGDDASVRRSIETFKTSQAHFPFTAYGIWDNNIVVGKTSFKSKSGRYYSSLYEAYIKTFPCQITIPMVSFFANPHDYERAFQLLYGESTIASRINVPIYINESLTYFPVNIEYTVAKGSFAGQFDEHLKIGNIWGLSHNFTLSFFYFNVNANDQHGNSLRIAPVDNMYANFYSFNNPDYRDNPDLIDALQNYALPVVGVTVPVEDAVGVSRTASIVFNFNTSMNKDSVKENIDFIPFIDARFIWDDTSTILTLQLAENLLASTAYEITIKKEANSSDSQNLEDDFILQFTTGL